MPAVLLDESSNRSRRGRISTRPRRFARENFDGRNSSFESRRRGNNRMKLSAVLLAGGKSRRMGRDKSAILFRDSPLWQRQLDILRNLEPKELFVSAQTDPPWRPVDVEFVADAQPSRGPLSGIAAALPCAASGHLLALAIDMPFMTDDYLRELFQGTGPHRGIVPMIDNRAEPLAAIYPRDVAVDFT